MSATNPFFVIFPLLSCLLSVWLIKRRSFDASTQGRFASIDGLRGYLAFFVFLYHTCTNYSYVTIGKWDTPNTNLYLFLGHGSVQLFFMITSFLFYSKLLQTKPNQTKPNQTSWVKFYLSRLLRLYPLYLFSISLVFIVVLYLSKGVQRESYWELAKHVASWVLFGLFGLADINEINTHVINAGVIWSLSYEWIFYLSMPVLAYILKQENRINWIIFSLIGILLLASMHSLFEGRAFIGGILAAYLIRNDKFIMFAKSKIATCLIFICILGLVQEFIPNNTYVMLGYLLLIFVLIASGNHLFGILVHPISRALGDLSYSIYLLHGILLFVAFNILIEKSIVTSANVYWGVVTIIAPILIFICHCTYRYIEYPAMTSTDKVMVWLKKVAKKNDQKTQSYSA